MLPTSYKSQWYLYCIVVALIVAGAAFGGFYLGSYTTRQTMNVASKQIYDQGVITGIQQANNQCAQLFLSVNASCEKWEIPPKKLGINLVGGP